MNLTYMYIYYQLFELFFKYNIGPIWMNINYLVLGALHHNYASKPGPHQALAHSIYQELRQNIISNMFRVRI